MKLEEFKLVVFKDKETNEYVVFPKSHPGILIQTKDLSIVPDKLAAAYKHMFKEVIDKEIFENIE